MVYEYLETLKEHNIEPINDWLTFLDSDSMQLAKMFDFKYADEKLEYNEREERQKNQIRTFITGKNAEFIENTFIRLDSVYKDAIKTKDTYWIDSSLVYLFQALAEIDSELYYKALELVMLGKHSFELNYGNIIFYPIRKKLVSPEEVYRRINRYEYKQKQFWKQLFFDAVEENEITEFFLQEFVGFLFSVSGRYFLYELNKLNKFDRQFLISKSLLPPSALSHNSMITYATEILLSKSGTADISFDRHICEMCSGYFVEKIDSLKQVFYLHKKRDTHYDREGKELSAISSIDKNFLIEYLKETTKDISFIGFRFDSLNLTFIWDLPEYEELLDEALEIIIAKAPIFSNLEHQANVLFKGLKLNEERLEKVYVYISRFISKNRFSKEHIHIILNVVTWRFNNQILRFLREFIVLNNDVEFVKSLMLEKGGTISGSRVPKIENHILFLKSIVEMIKGLENPLDYADHINLWEKKIEWAKKDKQYALKNDFKGWMN